MNRLGNALVLGAALTITAAASASAQNLPAGFTVEDAVPGAGFTVPTCIAFMPDGRMLVGEKAGQVWVVRNGVKRTTPMLAIQPKVLNDVDRGLLDVAVDPNYAVNHFVYFLFTVDPDSDGVDTNSDGYGRLVRYRTSAADSNVVDATTRTVLFGTGWRDSPIIGSPSHSIGAMRWGRDGSLMVSMGDGAQFNGVDAGGQDAAMFGTKVANPYEDVGAYRSQNLWSMDGKILRIDPATGHGYPSNPFWDGQPMSVRSRVWAYGLRNPFRFTVRPGTGSLNPADGQPGTLYIGDVGWDTWEEMNVSKTGGENFGWPCYEGIYSNYPYQSTPPSHGGCDSIGTTWNPDNVTLPIATWNHNDPNLSIPQGIQGNTSIGGVFYTGTLYPNVYHGRYFFADYGQNWIKLAITDSTDHLVGIVPFADNADGPVDLELDPSSGDLFYVAINTFQVRRIRWAGGTSGNTPPVAQASGAPTLGTPPLNVTFSSAGTYDIDGDTLSYTWTFGDGGGSTDPNPTHSYTSAGNFLAVLGVDDGHGGFAADTVAITVASNSQFPTTPVQDNFNRPDGPIGGAWVGELTDLAIVGNTLSQPGGGYATTVWSGAAFDTTQEAYVTLQHISPNAPEHDVLLKIQGLSTFNGHIECRYDDFQKDVFVSTYSPSQGWVLHGTFPIQLHDGDQYGARAYGSGLVDVFVNHVKLGSADCSSWDFAHGGGYIGMTISDAVESHLDNFGGGNAIIINQKPHAQILPPPADSTFYVAGDTLTIIGSKSDPEDPPSALIGHWSNRLVHNNHTHILTEADGDTASIITENHDDGTGVYLLLRYIVTDTGGLKDTATVHVFPENDLEPSPVTILPSEVGTGSSPLFRFSIMNHGRLPARIMHWVLRAGSTAIAQGDTIVAALDSVVYHRNIPINLAAGDYALRLTVDTLNVVVETNENNNSTTRTMTVLGVPLAVGDAPLTLALSNPWPNPTSGTARFALSLPAAAHVGFSVLDVQGRIVWEAPDQDMPPGRTSLVWDGRRDGGTMANAGLYLARVTVNGKPMLRRIAIIH